MRNAGWRHPVRAPRSAARSPVPRLLHGTHPRRFPANNSLIWRKQPTLDESEPETTPGPADTPAQEPATPLVSASLVGAHANGRIEAQAIAEICLIAGTPQRTAEFLASGMNEAQVRRALLEARAEQPEIASRITADAGTTVQPESSPVVAAVKKLATKE